MTILSLVPDALPTPSVVHHPSCPVRAGSLPCICPPATGPIEEELCPQCEGELQVWKVMTGPGWAEWLACLSCDWREQL